MQPFRQAFNEVGKLCPAGQCRFQPAIVDDHAWVAVLRQEIGDRGELVLHLPRFHQHVVEQVAAGRLAAAPVAYHRHNRIVARGRIGPNDIQRPVPPQIVAGRGKGCDGSVGQTGRNLFADANVGPHPRRRRTRLHDHEIRWRRAANTRLNLLLCGQNGTGNKLPAIPIPTIQFQRLIGLAIIWNRDLHDALLQTTAAHLHFVYRALGLKTRARQQIAGGPPRITRIPVQEFCSRNAVQADAKRLKYAFRRKYDRRPVRIHKGTAVRVYRCVGQKLNPLEQTDRRQQERRNDQYRNQYKRKNGRRNPPHPGGRPRPRSARLIIVKRRPSHFRSPPFCAALGQGRYVPESCLLAYSCL